MREQTIHQPEEQAPAHIKRLVVGFGVLLALLAVLALCGLLTRLPAPLVAAALVLAGAYAVGAAVLARED